MKLTEKLFTETLIESGIKTGDLLLIHSNLSLFGFKDYEDNIASVILNSIEKVIGISGTILLPAFTYSLSKKEVFKPISRNGLKEMGMLTLRAFENKFPRTLDPIFSLIVNGKKSSEILSLKENTSNGPGSVFDYLLDNNLKVLNLNLGAGSTIIHEIEFRFGVNYRFMKEFRGLFENPRNNKVENISWRAFVRKLDVEGSQASFRQLTKDFKKTKHLRERKLGQGVIRSYDSKDLIKFLQTKLMRYPEYLTSKFENLSQ